MTPQEARGHLTTRIDRIPDSDSVLVEKDVLRAILAEVTPEAGGDMQSPLAHPGDLQSFGPETYTSGGVLDRDQARDALAWRISDVLMRVYDNGTSPNARREAEEVVKAIEDDLDGVRPAAIDRDALRLQVWKAVTAAGGTVDDRRIDYATDCIFALVRPVAGVVLSPEEVRRVLDWYTDPALPFDPVDRALAARLEAAQ